MHFVSVQFLVFVALSLTIFHVAASLRAKRLALLATNLTFVGCLVATPARMIPMACVLTAGFGFVRLAQDRRRRTATTWSIVAVVTAFVYLKRYSVVAWLPASDASYSVVGLSYVLFRVLHLIIDGHDGAIRERITAMSFVNYCCSFLTWLSGPIQRYEEYVAQEQRLAEACPSRAEVHGALSRIVTGYFKVAILSGALFELHAFLLATPLAQAASAHFVAVVGLAASFYALYMYYNFAGYMDVVIGLGALYGLRLPENFDRPFAAGSFLEFWSRWHITLSEWFKVYVFNPTTKALASRWGTARSMPYLGVAAYFVTFAVMGVWHGSTPLFVVYGVLLGGGVSANKLYEIEARRLLGKDGLRRLRSNGLYAALCRGAVFAYFATALVCFWVTPSLGRQLQARWLLAILAVGAVVVGATAVSTGLSLAARGWASVAERVRGRFESPVVRHAWLGAKTYAVASLILVQTTAVPAFVYLPF